MQAEDRLIHFSTELMHAPKQHAVAALQKLYYELSQTRTSAFDSSDFSVPASPKFHSKRGARAQSLALFLPDRIVLVEEWVDIPLSAFLEKVREVGLRSQSSLEIPEFSMQAVVLRSTFALSHFADARVFLMDRLCGQEGRIETHFQRPIGIGGLRFLFPETPEHPGSLQVIIESFQHSVNEIFVEVKGVFPQQHITSANLYVLTEHIQKVRTFITEHVFSYLNQYDRATK